MSEPAPQPSSDVLAIDAGAASLRPIHSRLQAFDLWLIAALALHTALLAGFMSARPRQLGDASGMEGAISVSLVTEAELRGHATVAEEGGGPPSPPTPQLRPQISELTPPPQAPPQAEAMAPPPPEAPAAERATEPVSPEAVTEQLKGTAPDAGLPGDTGSQPAERQTPSAPAKKAETKLPVTKPAQPKPQSKTRDTKTAKLDLSLPPPMAGAPAGGRGAGIERPPGITRSGENDAFARGVIRALQQTMPQLRDTRGRVRVRITLDRNGNLVSTQVLMPSDVAGLDQSVVFATRQTSFPLPPNNAVQADLVFVVTYIYR